MPRQLTVRHVSEDLHRRLEAVSRSRRQSVNQTVLAILEGALGRGERRRRLERYATWTAEDLRRFEEALALQRQIDDAAWR
ncbi:MAG: FitA-like ribbon-helix-helix domain-containing protein [Thermoanaerobaculia bacterium]